jgi:hypothetical protein
MLRLAKNQQWTRFAIIAGPSHPNMNFGPAAIVLQLDVNVKLPVAAAVLGMPLWPLLDKWSFHGLTCVKHTVGWQVVQNPQ